MKRLEQFLVSHPDLVTLIERYRKTTLLLIFFEFVLFLVYLDYLLRFYDRLFLLEGHDLSNPVTLAVNQVTYTREVLELEVPFLLDRYGCETFNHELIARELDHLDWTLRVELQRLESISAEFKFFSTGFDLYNEPPWWSFTQIWLVRAGRRLVLGVFLVLFVRLFLRYDGVTLVKKLFRW